MLSRKVGEGSLPLLRRLIKKAILSFRFTIESPSFLAGENIAHIGLYTVKTSVDAPRGKPRVKKLGVKKSVE